MSASADSSFGTTLTFGTTGYTCDLLDIVWDGITRDKLETSHMGLAAPGAGKFGNKTYIPGGLQDPGEIQVSCHYNPDDVAPIDSEVLETITVQFPPSGGDSTGARIEVQGFVKDLGINLNGPDGVMAHDFVIACSGNAEIFQGAV